MRLVRNPVIGWKILPLPAYSRASISNSSSTGGVIQPPQTLSRGNLPFSRSATSNPARISFQAQAEPAGPAPTIRTSHESISTPAWGPTRPGRGNLGSREPDYYRTERTQSGTTAANRSGRQPGIQPDRDAMLLRNPR